MSLTFRRAVRENVGLLIGLIGPSGGGKTRSAMRLATGMATGKPFCVLDTEARRALHYAEDFTFDHADLTPPFRPDAYADAIHSADKAGYPVIVVDSFSHEHAGEGGLLEYHEDELQRMAGDDWKKREACKMAAWIKPKTSHKAMIQRLLQVRAHLILCFRAEEKVEIVRGSDGKTQIVPKGFQPICEKNTPYELTASFLLTPDAPGVPKPLKLQSQHRLFVSLDSPIDEHTGERLAQWAAGGVRPVTAIPAPTEPDEDAMRTATLLAIEKERATLRPTPQGFAKVCEYFTATGGLAHADLSALDDLLAFLRALTAKDPEATATLDQKILKRSADVPLTGGQTR